MGDRPDHKLGRGERIISDGELNMELERRREVGYLRLLSRGGIWYQKGGSGNITKKTERISLVRVEGGWI